MNLRLLFALPPKPPQQTDEERRNDTTRLIMRRKARICLLTPDEVESRLTACLNENAQEKLNERE